MNLETPEISVEYDTIDHDIELGKTTMRRRDNSPSITIDRFRVD
jgi:hypothetical protein